MAYSTNPNLPFVRAEAVRLVQSGWSARKVARYLGYRHNTILGWLKRPLHYGPCGRLIIPTRSSRPHMHPQALSQEMIRKVLAYRQERNQCADILHHRLITDGYTMSLSSVKRVLRKHHCSRYSKWKKWHQYPERPKAEKPGVLVEIDTIHDGPHEDRLYIYTMLDVCSRFAHATPVERINTNQSLCFVRTAPLPFPITTVQSDHGPEFSKWFTKMVGADGVAHRNSRVRKPNDNAHLERFNRTIQDECLNRIPRSLPSWQKEIPEYLRYYNEKRPHMGLQFKTPIEVATSY